MVVDKAKVPVIETGAGNCHVYVDEGADLQMATDIVVNAKTQRPSVCNAMEKLVVNQAVAAKLLPMVAEALKPFNVDLRGDERAKQILPKSVQRQKPTGYGIQRLYNGNQSGG